MKKIIASIASLTILVNVVSVVSCANGGVDQKTGPTRDYENINPVDGDWGSSDFGGNGTPSTTTKVSDALWQKDHEWINVRDYFLATISINLPQYVNACENQAMSFSETVDQSYGYRYFIKNVNYHAQKQSELLHQDEVMLPLEAANSYAKFKSDFKNILAIALQLNVCS